MRIIGIVLAVVGALLLYFGFQSSQGVAEKVVEGVSGRYTEGTMGYIIGGVALLVGGVALIFFSNRAR